MDQQSVQIVWLQSWKDQKSINIAWFSRVTPDYLFLLSSDLHLPRQSEILTYAPVVGSQTKKKKKEDDLWTDLFICMVQYEGQELTLSMS